MYGGYTEKANSQSKITYLSYLRNNFQVSETCAEQQKKYKMSVGFFGIKDTF